MDLDLTEEQEMLAEMVRGVCAENAPLDTVRELEDDPVGYPKALWKQLGELGLLGLLIPEEHGGSEQSLLEAALVYEEFGRALAPIPHFGSCVLGALTLIESGSAGQREELLPKIVSGDAILTPAWLEPDNGYGAKGVQLKAEVSGDDVTLSGTKLHVVFGGAATHLIVLARTGPAESDVDLFLVDPNADGVKLSQQLSLASDSQYRVDFSNVRVSTSDRIGDAQSGWKTWNGVMHQAIVLAGAQAVGGAQRALEITADYAKERKQFDKPLGAFQAISHYLADASTNIDGARTLVLEAAWAASQGRDIARLAPMAKMFACQTFRDMTAMCQQVWGGVGFTVEYDIQLFFRRAKQLQLSWWDTRYLEELIASDVLGDGGA